MSILRRSDPLVCGIRHRGLVIAHKSAEHAIRHSPFAGMPECRGKHNISDSSLDRLIHKTLCMADRYSGE